jgi:hypothetical protein
MPVVGTRCLQRNHPMALRCRRVDAVHSITSKRKGVAAGCLLFPRKQTLRQRRIPSRADYPAPASASLNHPLTIAIHDAVRVCSRQAWTAWRSVIPERQSEGMRPSRSFPHRWHQTWEQQPSIWYLKRPMSSAVWRSTPARLKPVPSRCARAPWKDCGLPKCERRPLSGHNKNSSSPPNVSCKMRVERWNKPSPVSKLSRTS